VTAYYRRTHVLRDVYNICFTLFEFYFFSEYISSIEIYVLIPPAASGTPNHFGFFLTARLFMFTITNKYTYRVFYTINSVTFGI